MKLITRTVSALVLTAAVFGSVSAFAATPGNKVIEASPEGDTLIERQFNTFRSDADWNND